MPDFTYSGPGARFYPEGRDAAGQNIGEVQPGDIRDLEQAPDGWWHETTDEDRAALAARQAAAEQAAQDEAAPAEAEAGTAADGGDAGSGPPPPAVPQPVPGA